MRWYSGAILLLLIGLALQLELLVFAMYALIGVMLVSRYFARNWIENLSAQRDCNRISADIGDTVAVVVSLHNTGKIPITWVLLEDSLPRDALMQRPPRISVKNKRYGITELSPGGVHTLNYQVTFLMRGYYQIGPLLAETGDLFGLHRRYRVLSEPRYVLVYPKVVHLEGYDLASRRPIGEVRMMHRLFEDPTRISGVRAYQQGDPLNRIHWRATARTGQLHSKTYEPSTIAGITLLLDFHRDTYPLRGEPYRSELAVTAVASLANTVYQMGQQIGFFTNGRDAADRIRQEGFRHDFRTRIAAQTSLATTKESDRLRPVEVRNSRGAEQLTRILEALARVELTDGLTFAQLVLEVSGHLPRDATVAAVLSDVSPETAITLGSLKRGGYAVTAFLLATSDEYEDAERAGRLLAEGIDVRQIHNENSISEICSTRLLRA